MQPYPKVPGHQLHNVHMDQSTNGGIHDNDCSLDQQSLGNGELYVRAKSMDESRTAVHIAQTLGEVADAFSIPTEKRVAIVRNNAGNMVLCTKT